MAQRLPGQRAREITRCVAPVAVAPEATVVHIILTMTPATRTGQIRFLQNRPAVTGMTVDTLMPAVQLESGLRVMVKFP